MPVAETYKGLTIRLGGDSSGLQQALKAISSSVATTESQLRKLKQALKLDPGNADALTKSLDLMGNRAIETQRRVQTLKKQIDQIGSEKVQLLGGKQSAETVRQLADATDDASERAAEARRNYNKITEELAEFYAPIDKAVNATKNLDVQAGTALAEVKRLGDEYRALTGKDFKASSFISDSKDADQAIQQLRELGLITDEQVSKLTNLRESFRNAFNENQVAQAVSKLDQMGTSLIKAEAEAKNVTKRFSEMSRAAMMSKYGEGVEDQLKHIENAANSVEAELKQLDDALALDPNNVELTAAKIRDLQEASNIAQSRVETLNEKLRRLQSDGAEELANDMLDVRMEVEKTSQAYDEATAEVKQMEAELRDAEVKLKNLKSSGEGLDDGFEEAKQDVDRLTSSLEELRAAQKLTETAFKNANMAQEFVETKNAVNKAEAELNRPSQDTEFVGGSYNWPVPGYTRISSYYGWRTLYGKPDWHTGIDISQGGIYGASIVASLSGTVQTVVYGSRGYGYYVIVDHGGNNKTLYGHMSRIDVTVGQQVVGGVTVLGGVGSTGNSTGPHLHFEIRLNGQQVDPAPYLGR